MNSRRIDEIDLKEFEQHSLMNADLLVIYKNQAILCNFLT